MGGQQDRHAARAQLAHELPGVPAGGRIEPGRRLVQVEQRRIADQAEGKVQAALLPAGQRPDLAALQAGQAHQPDDLGHAARRPVVAGRACDRLADGQVRLDRDVLQDQAGPLTQLAGAGPLAGVVAEDLGCPAVAGAEALQDLQRRGLAGPVRPEQRDDLAVADGEADVSHGVHPAVALAQAGDLDRVYLRTHRTSSVRSR